MIKSCSLAESTKKVREGQWACYLRFCKRFKLSPYCSSAHQASLYATFLSKSMVYSSICNYLHAVVYFHNLSGIKPPCLSAAELRTTLLGIKRRSRHNVNVKSPVYPRHLLSMFTAVQSKHELMVYVASLLLFRCLLRVSHVTRSPHELKWSDVTFHGWGITVHVTSSKTNQLAHTRVISPCLRSPTNACVYPTGFGCSGRSRVVYRSLCFARMGYVCPTLSF